MVRADVVIIGGGAMGSAAAWWLARRGRDVVLLEQFEQGHGRGSSHGGSRIFRLAYDQPEYVGMAQAALPLWRELEDDAGRPLLLTTGGVDHGPAERVRPITAALEACRATCLWLSPEEATARWPVLRFDEHVLFQPDAGCCLADDTVRALQERAQSHGAVVRFDARAACRVDGDRVEVRTADETYQARVAVLAAGSWAAPLLAGVKGIRRPVALPRLRVTQEQVFHFRPVDERADQRDSAWPSFIHHRMPWRYGLLTPGEGVKVAEHGTGPETDPDARTFVVEDAGRARVCDYVAAWIPGVMPEPVSATTCLYTTTPTEDFIVDRVAGSPLVVAAGFSGHGFKFTPLIGQMLADLAEGRTGTAHPRLALANR
jgi:sarcosine oxidase